MQHSSFNVELDVAKRAHGKVGIASRRVHRPRFSLIARLGKAALARYAGVSA